MTTAVQPETTTDRLASHITHRLCNVCYQGPPQAGDFAVCGAMILGEKGQPGDTQCQPCENEWPRHKGEHMFGARG